MRGFVWAVGCIGLFGCPLLELRNARFPFSQRAVQHSLEKILDKSLLFNLISCKAKELHIMDENQMPVNPNSLDEDFDSYQVESEVPNPQALYPELFDCTSLGTTSEDVESFDDSQLANDIWMHANWAWRRGSGRANKGDLHGMLVCIDSYIKGSIDDAMGAFLHLQNHNRAVQEQIRVGQRRLGARFWDITFYCHDIAPNFAEANRHITWQYENEAGSLERCINTYNAGETLRAYYHLLYNQRHNGDALSVYRGCWLVDKAQIISIIRRLIGG